MRVGVYTMQYIVLTNRFMRSFSAFQRILLRTLVARYRDDGLFLLQFTNALNTTYINEMTNYCII